ncbi:hypothetical protein FQA39_LY16450 [Lamprigera yunnana]|nr:hypothetical protein FQA39_LY16450 [Lamprigera yunnana]
MSDLAKLYSSFMKDMGIDHIAHSSRLQDLLLNACSCLQSLRKIGQDCLITFQDDLDQVMRSASRHFDSEAKQYCDVAKVLRKDIFDCGSSSWEQGLGDQNRFTPLSLRTFLKMLFRGPGNISSAREEQSEAEQHGDDQHDDQVISTLSQLICYHTQKIPRFWALSTPVPMYLGMKIFGETRSKKLIQVAYKLGLGLIVVANNGTTTGYRTRRGEKYLPSGSGAKPIKKWVYFNSLMFLEPYMTERNTSTNLKKVSNNTTNRSLCNNVSSQSYAKAYMLNDDGILVSDEAEESDQNTEEYNSQTNPHVDDETYSPSVSDVPSTPEGPTSGSRKKRKSKLNPVDKRFLTFFEKKHESTAKREKSSNELFLASLLEDMNKLQQDDLRKFKIIMLSKLGEFLDKYI